MSELYQQIQQDTQEALIKIIENYNNDSDIEFDWCEVEEVEQV